MYTQCHVRLPKLTGRRSEYRFTGARPGTDRLNTDGKGRLDRLEGADREQGSIVRAPDTSALREDPEWSMLIRKLRERKASLIEDFRSRFPAQTLYEAKVSDGELYTLVESTMEMYLVLLAGERLDSNLERVPHNLGRRRAQQGVSEQQLLEGVRANSRVIWNALREISNDKSMAALVRNTDAVLGLVEWHVRAVQSAYLREEDSLNRNIERRRQRAIARIFDGKLQDRDDIAALALELGIPAGAELDISVQLGQHDVDCRLCPGHPSRTFVHELPGATCHFCLTGALDLLGELRGCHATVLHHISGLAGLPDAARSGMVIAQARAAHRPEPVTINQAWPTVAWKQLTAALAPEILPVSLGALAELAPFDRQRLVETVKVYFSTGSIKETATQLFCHRNTIVKRLNKFEELVGLNLAIPAQAALAVLALSAFDGE